MRPQRLAPMLALLAVLAVPLAAAVGAGGNGKGDEPPPAPVGSAPDCRTPTETVAPQTIVGVWNCAVLEEVRASKPLRNGPPIVARAGARGGGRHRTYPWTPAPLIQLVDAPTALQPLPGTGPGGKQSGPYADYADSPGGYRPYVPSNPLMGYCTPLLGSCPGWPDVFDPYSTPRRPGAHSRE